MNGDIKPFELFADWFEIAQKENDFEPTQMTLATLSEDGIPSARVVLLKKYNEQGLCFFTNYNSGKAKDLAFCGKASVVFHWEKPFHRQIRVRGLVEKLTAEESQDYFSTRARGSQLGAWASPQSQPIKNRQELESLVKGVEEQFPFSDPVPCPDFWGGYRLVPLQFEFWQAGEHRLHDRRRFERADQSSSWSSQRLAP